MKCPKCEQSMIIILGDDDPNTEEEVGLETHQCPECGYEETIDDRKHKKPIHHRLFDWLRGI
jgi:predicted RNA-binding Zn-ribbon protein involved in translation (DUF1610 family)